MIAPQRHVVARRRLLLPLPFGPSVVVVAAAEEGILRFRHCAREVAALDDAVEVVRLSQEGEEGEGCDGRDEDSKEEGEGLRQGEDAFAATFRLLGAMVDEDDREWRELRDAEVHITSG